MTLSVCSYLILKSIDFWDFIYLFSLVLDSTEKILLGISKLHRSSSKLFFYFQRSSWSLEVWKNTDHQLIHCYVSHLSNPMVDALFQQLAGIMELNSRIHQKSRNSRTKLGLRYFCFKNTTVN